MTTQLPTGVNRFDCEDQDFYYIFLWKYKRNDKIISYHCLWLVGCLSYGILEKKKKIT